MSIRPFPPGKECLDFMKDGAQPVPDADISGLGVILAFTVSAYLTFALVLASYLFGQVDGSLLNSVDTQVFHIRPFRPLRTRNDKPTRLRVSQALRQAVLALSDQQIVTGIAILGAGFQGLRLGGIDSYHYQTVIYLAWMSSSVHLSALSILAPILKERPALRIWRLVGMLVLLVLLVIALIPTASNDWGLLTWEGMTSNNSGWGVPAVCFWATTYGDGVNPDAVLGFLILLISYGWKVGGLFEGVCSAYQRWIRYPVQWAFESLLTLTARKYLTAHVRNNTNCLAWLTAHRIVVAVWVPYFAVFETLASFSTAIWISCLGLVFGTIQIAIPRMQNQPLLGENENTWGFGQLVPLILLIQPFSVVWEHLVVLPKRSTEEESEDRSISPVSKTATHVMVDSNASQQVKPSVSLLESLVTYKAIKPTDRIHSQPTPIEQIVLRSSLFRINVYLTQPSILVAAIMAFATDASYIGYSTTGNWSWFCIILAGYVGAAWLLTFCLLPWLALGRVPEAWEEIYNAGLGQVEDDIGLRGDCVGLWSQPP